MKVSRRLMAMIAGGAAVLAATATLPGTLAEAADEPPLQIAAGASLKITQKVQTPFVPPQPDIVLLVDRTGSMGPAVTDVKSKMAGVVAAVRAAEPTARFAVAAYCDTGDSAPSYQTIAPLSADAAAVIDALIAMPLCYGGDLPEAQLDALYRLGESGKAMAFRPQSQRIVAWFGDAPGHSRLRTEQAAIASLKAARARVVAVSVGRNQLDSVGQATRITRATGGSLLSAVSPDRVASAILQGITSLPVQVEAKASCDRGLSIDFAAHVRTVPRGTTATFGETLTVAEGVAEGTTLGCTVRFMMDGVDLGADYRQRISVVVGSTAPVLPSDTPSDQPSDQPSNQPSETATAPPSEQSTSQPSETASSQPANEPSAPAAEDSVAPAEPASPAAPDPAAPGDPATPAAAG